MIYLKLPKSVKVSHVPFLLEGDYDVIDYGYNFLLLFSNGAILYIPKLTNTPPTVTK